MCAGLWETESQKWRLVKATYGSHTSQKDVVTYFSDHKWPIVLAPEVQPNTYFGGDPDVGQPKELRLTFQQQPKKDTSTTIIIREYGDKLIPPTVLLPNSRLFCLGKRISAAEVDVLREAESRTWANYIFF